MSTETTEVTSDVVTDDGMVITPTDSPTQPPLSDRWLGRIATRTAFVAALVVGFTLMVSMGLTASVTHDLKSPIDTYDTAGVCHNEAFAVTEFNQDTFAEYQAKHPATTPYEVRCVIPFENNRNHH